MPATSSLAPSRSFLHYKSAASLCAYQILHAFSTRNVWILLHVYITYVRPKLEYNTVIWSPYLKKDFELESVRKKFTRDICVRCNISFNSYFDRLNKLNIKSLKYRRLEFDMIYMYKICYDLCDVKFSDFFDSLQTGDNLHHKLTVKCIKSPKLNSYLHFFCNLIPSVWNSWPESIVCANTLPAFKSKLKKFDWHSRLLSA